MGCGGSKFDPENIAPTGLRPLRRRIEEIRRRRNAAEIKESTLSTKELLDDAADDADTSPADSIHNDCRKSVSLPAESVEAPKESALVQEEDVKAKVPESDVAVEKPCSKEKEEEVKKKEAEGKRGEPALAKSIEEEEEEEGEEEEEEEEEEGRGLCKCEASDVGPGSPSFREYYVASVRNSIDSDSAENIKDEDKKSAGTKENKSRRKDSNASANSSEGSFNKLMKKGKKGRRFRKVLPKGGQVGHGVKNFLNVRSCYNPACSSSGHDSPRLLAEKAAA